MRAWSAPFLCIHFPYHPCQHIVLVPSNLSFFQELAAAQKISLCLSALPSFPSYSVPPLPTSQELAAAQKAKKLKGFEAIKGVILFDEHFT